MNYIPYVVDQKNERGYDIFSRLLNDRIIMLSGEINDDSASIIVASLLYLDSICHDKISLYINSGGGSVTSGMQIIDTMSFIASPVETICLGCAMSMAAVILACGEKRMRYALANSEMMIHQPSGGFNGTELDVKIYAQRLTKIKDKLYKILAEKTGNPLDLIEEKSQRDCFLDSDEALSFGIIDKIISKRPR